MTTAVPNGEVPGILSDYYPIGDKVPGNPPPKKQISQNVRVLRFPLEIYELFSFRNLNFSIVFFYN